MRSAALDGLHHGLLAAGLLLTLLSLGCSGDRNSAEAGVGGDRTGCEQPGSNSVKLSDHSCTCEGGYAWCSDALDDFDCCAVDELETGETGEPGDTPALPCDADQVEQRVCLLGPAGADDPGSSSIWACNGERWVLVPGYSNFACMADGFPFAYGCLPGDPAPSFLCGYGQGSTCDPLAYAGVCNDEDIIDTCVWGLRTVDRCSRLCAELGVFGPGFAGGACSQPSPELPAACECCVDC